MEPTHGLGILNRLNDLVPDNRLDTAVIYRQLKEMEGQGWITSDWEDSDAGPKKKVYAISQAGRDQLADFQKDIQKSMGNLQRFLTLYEETQA